VKKPSPIAAPSALDASSTAGLANLGTVPEGDLDCVWMRAGILRYKLCDRRLDCVHCPLDAGLRGATPTDESQADSGQGSFRLFPRDRRFSRGHLWVYPREAHVARVGIDALGAWLMPDIVAVDLPANDTWLECGQPLATLSGANFRIQVNCPTSGRVAGRNVIASSCPELITAAPYHTGWLVDLAISPERQSDDWDRLLPGPEMERLARADIYRFHQRADRLIHGPSLDVGPPLSDGGEPMEDLQRLLGPARYANLVQEFVT
jgi:glycine cleavage system H lipoate-binding protein